MLKRHPEFLSLHLHSGYEVLAFVQHGPFRWLWFNNALSIWEAHLLGQLLPEITLSLNE